MPALQVGRLRRHRWLAGSALLVALGAALAGFLLYGSMYRLSSWLGPSRAIEWRVELGLRLGQARSKRALLLAGDSRLEIDGPLLRTGGWTEINVAMGGTALSDWDEWLVERPAARRYDAVIFWAGINDFLHRGAAVDATAEHLAAIARRLRRYARRVFVLEQIPVRVPPQEGDAVHLSVQIAELNRGVHERLAGASSVTIVAAHDELRAPDGLLQRWCSDDGLHLNAEGRAWLRRRIANLSP